MDADKQKLIDMDPRFKEWLEYRDFLVTAFSGHKYVAIFFRGATISVQKFNKMEQFADIRHNCEENYGYKLEGVYNAHEMVRIDAQNCSC